MPDPTGRPDHEESARGAVREKDPQALDELDEQLDGQGSDSPPVSPAAGGGRQHNLHKAGEDVRQGLRDSPAGPGSPAAEGLDARTDDGD